MDFTASYTVKTDSGIARKTFSGHARDHAESIRKTAQHLIDTRVVRRGHTTHTVVFANSVMTMKFRRDRDGWFLL